MTTTTAPPTSTTPRPMAPLNRPHRRLGDRLLFGYTWLIILWLAFPIGIMILFGFNNTPGRYNQTWRGFTTSTCSGPSPT